jgi:predicted secreted hydrolase
MPAPAEGFSSPLPHAEEVATKWRVRALLWFLLAFLLLPRAEAQVTYPPVVPGATLEFPRDEGSHPDFRLEWWYVTGWLESDGERQPRGFQVTFFRVRTGIGEDNPSAFAPRQVLFAHAAIADPAVGKLRHAERTARAGFGLVEAKVGGVDVRLDDWSLVQGTDGRYRAVIRDDAFELRLDLTATQPPLLQGERGFSRKGPDPRAASYYYSLPQLQVSGEVVIDGQVQRVRGRAWFDHEWSSDYVDERAAGWDWMGINLADGGALMVFRMRDSQGGARWGAATHRMPSPDAIAPTSPAHGRGDEPSPDLRSTSPTHGRGVEMKTFEPDEVEWSPLATWRSPRTGVEYPVRWRVRVGAATYRVESLMEDAELDSRGSTGVLYWEGPVRLLDDASGRELGRGYLELTGYASKLDF